MRLGDFAFSYAYTILPRFTDLDPYCWRIQFEFGRLIPIGVVGAASPVSITAVITFAEIPFTFFFLCSGMRGELSSNHCACPPIAAMRLLASISFTETVDSKLPFLPSGSPYTSIYPFTTSIAEAVSATQAML